MREKKKFKYSTGRIRIISNVELTKTQIGKVVNAVNEVMLLGFYEPCYDISREICHE